jgi:hypothetical protein
MNVELADPSHPKRVPYQAEPRPEVFQRLNCDSSQF